MLHYDLFAISRVLNGGRCLIIRLLITLISAPHYCHTSEIKAKSDFTAQEKNLSFLNTGTNSRTTQ